MSTAPFEWQSQLSPPDPIAAAQRAMRAPLRRRFYRSVEIVAAEDGYAIALDGRPARTPGRASLSLPVERAAAGVAAEWSAQGEYIDPARMPLTRIVNSAIDGVRHEAAAVRNDIVRYARSDLLLYRASEPPRLAAAQAAAWDPVLDFLSDRFAARFLLSEGIVYAEQPSEAIARVADAVAAFEDPIALACLHVITTLTGSALLALALAEGNLSAQAAWSVAHVDEDYQMSIWGADREALQRRECQWLDMQAAAQLLELLDGGRASASRAATGGR